MNRAQRRIANRVAGWLEDGAEWLRTKAERKSRPRPLRFPTAFELTMRSMTEAAAKHYAEDILGFSGAIWRGVKFRVSDDGEPVTFNRIRAPHEIAK